MAILRDSAPTESIAPIPWPVARANVSSYLGLEPVHCRPEANMLNYHAGLFLHTTPSTFPTTCKSPTMKGRVKQAICKAFSGTSLGASVLLSERIQREPETLRTAQQVAASLTPAQPFVAVPEARACEEKRTRFVFLLSGTTRQKSCNRKTLEAVIESQSRAAETGREVDKRGKLSAMSPTSTSVLSLRSRTMRNCASSRRPAFCTAVRD